MNNPLSDDPEFDLYPYPEGSAGWRLWKLMPEGTRRGQYLDMFERRNLLRARAWDQAKAREAALDLLPSLNGRLVVVLGSQVRAALGLPLSEPLTQRRFEVPLINTLSVGRVVFDWIAMPHPSGRNRWYNDPANAAQAGALLVTIAGKRRAEHPAHSGTS